MDFVEVEGNTVEEAIKKGLQKLNITREQAHIQVVAEGKQGLFGMKGAKPAKVRVSLKNKKNP